MCFWPDEAEVVLNKFNELLLNFYVFFQSIGNIPEKKCNFGNDRIKKQLILIHYGKDYSRFGSFLWL